MVICRIEPQGTGRAHLISKLYLLVRCPHRALGEALAAVMAVACVAQCWHARTNPSGAFLNRYTTNLLPMPPARANQCGSICAPKLCESHPAFQKTRLFRQFDAAPKIAKVEVSAGTYWSHAAPAADDSGCRRISSGCCPSRLRPARKMGAIHAIEFRHGRTGKQLLKPPASCGDWSEPEAFRRIFQRSRAAN